MKIITLCGSTRFRQAYIEWTGRLSLEGYAVFSVICFSHHLEKPLDPEEKRIADRLHKQKIARSDAVFVLDVGGYIGESTRSEIEFAKARGIPVRYLSQEYPTWTEAECRFVHQD